MELKRKTKPFRIAFNMLSCAICFAWAGVEPRETISGLFGRKCLYANGLPKRFWRAGRAIIDRIHREEKDHCAETAYLEHQARIALGYQPQ